MLYIHFHFIIIHFCIEILLDLIFANEMSMIIKFSNNFCIPNEEFILTQLFR